MPGKYYEYLKCGSYVVPVEISFLTSKVIYNKEVINTSKWIERHHWKEIKNLLKPALEACTNTDVFSKSPHVVFGNEVGLGYLIVNDREKFPFLAVLEPKNHCWTDDEDEDDEDLDQGEAPFGSLWHQRGTLTNYPPTKVYIKAAVTKRSSSSTEDTQKLRKELGCGVENDLRNYLEPAGHPSTSHSSKDKLKKDNYNFGNKQKYKSSSSGFGDENPVRAKLYPKMPKPKNLLRGKESIPFGRKYSDEDSDGYVEHDFSGSSSSSSDDDKDSLPDIPEVDLGHVPVRPTPLAYIPSFNMNPTKTSPSSPTKSIPQFNGAAKFSGTGISRPTSFFPVNGLINKVKTTNTSFPRSPIRTVKSKKNNFASPLRVPQRSPDITQIKMRNAKKPLKKVSVGNPKPSGELRELQINEQSNAVSPLKASSAKQTVPKTGSTTKTKAKPKNTTSFNKTPKSGATKTINGVTNKTRRKPMLRVSAPKPVTTENVPVELNRTVEPSETNRRTRQRNNTEGQEIDESQVSSKNKTSEISRKTPTEVILRKIKKEKDVSKNLEPESETMLKNGSIPSMKDNIAEEDLLPEDIDPEMPKLTPQIPFPPQYLANINQELPCSTRQPQDNEIPIPLLKASVPVITKVERFSPPIDTAFKKTYKGKKKTKVVHKSTSVSNTELLKNSHPADNPPKKTPVVENSTPVSKSNIQIKETESSGSNSTSSEKDDIFSFTHIAKNPTKPNDSDIFSAIALMPPPTRPAPRTPRKYISIFPTSTTTIAPTSNKQVVPSSFSSDTRLDKAGGLSHLSTFEILSNPSVLSTGIGLLKKMTAKNADVGLLGKKLGVLPISPEKPKRPVSPDITSLPFKKPRMVEPLKAIKNGSADSQSDDELDEYVENPEGERLIQELLNRIGNNEEDDFDYEPIGDEHDLSQRSMCCIRVFPGYSEKSRLYKIHSKKIQDLHFDELMKFYFELKPTLRDIFEGQEPSIRNKIYLEGPISRARLREMNVSIPFNNDQSSTLLQLLFDFFVPNGKDRPQWTDYINYVMLPETLIRIYSQVNDLPLIQAENEMRYGPCYDAPISTQNQ